MTAQDAPVAGRDRGHAPDGGRPRPHPGWDVAVLGLGETGTGLVRQAVQAGLRVVGFDVDERTVDGLNAGRSHVGGLADDELADLLNRGFRATRADGVLAHADAVLVCVPAPRLPDGTEDHAAVEAAARLLSVHLRPGALVVVESTTSPGTTDALVRPLLEATGLAAGSDFALAAAPAWVPGRTAPEDLPLPRGHAVPRVVGGVSPSCTDRALALYRRLADAVVPLDGARAAESARLVRDARGVLTPITRVDRP